MRCAAWKEAIVLLGVEPSISLVSALHLAACGLLLSWESLTLTRVLLSRGAGAIEKAAAIFSDGMNKVRVLYSVFFVV